MDVLEQWIGYILNSLGLEYESDNYSPGDTPDLLETVVSGLMSVGIDVSGIVSGVEYVTGSDYDPYGELDLSVPEQQVSWQSPDGTIYWVKPPDTTFLSTLSYCIKNFSFFGILSMIWKGIMTKPQFPPIDKFFDYVKKLDTDMSLQMNYWQFVTDSMKSMKNKKGKLDIMKTLAWRQTIVKDFMLMEKGKPPIVIRPYVQNQMVLDAWSGSQKVLNSLPVDPKAKPINVEKSVVPLLLLLFTFKLLKR